MTGNLPDTASAPAQGLVGFTLLTGSVAALLAVRVRRRPSRRTTGPSVRGNP